MQGCMRKTSGGANGRSGQRCPVARARPANRHAPETKKR